MKRTREDEPSKARRGWKRGRPAQDGDGSPPAAKPKRSSRSVFGPSGEDRPDVLTDAETVVLPIWLHRRAGSADGTSAGSAAAFLKTITVPAQGDKAARPAPGTGEPPETEAQAVPKAGADAAPGTGDAEAATEPEEGDPAPGVPADADHSESEPGEPGPGEPTEAGAAEAGGDTGAQAAAEADSVVDADAAAEAGTDTVAGKAAETGGETSAGAGTEADADTVVAMPRKTGAASGPAAPGTTESAASATTGPVTTGPRMTGPDAVTYPGPIRPDPEATTVLSRADLQSAVIQARTLEAIEAIEAIDALETTTLGGLDARTTKALETAEAISALEARTAQAIKTIEAMTAHAFEAIDATVAEATPELTSKLVPPDQAGQADEAEEASADEAETPAPDGADSAEPDHAKATSLDRAGEAGSSPGTDVARTRVIRIEEPPPSVTLVTSATETIIALPQPRAESLVSVAPAPPPAATSATPLLQAPSGKPPALPTAEPRPEAEPEDEPRRERTSRHTRVSRALLLCILCLQAILSLRLHRSAFEDEALYLYSGHMELEHLLHGSGLQGTYASYFSGAPVLYPVAAAAVNDVGGLAAVRALSLLEMLATTTLLYALTRRLFNERVALCAAALFSVTAAAVFLGDFATYDATCLFLLATAAWIMVRTAVFRWPVFLLAAPVAALAVGVKYAGLLFVPTIAVLPVLAGWPARGWRVLLHPLVFAAAVGGLLYAGLRVGGHAYQAAISQTTTNRAQGAVPVTTFLREFAEWGGVIFVLAVIGTVAYIWRVRTEPGEQIGTVGGRFWRAALGVVLTGTALLAPVYQAHLHTDISFQKHIGFGLFFAAPMAGLGLSRILGDHLRRPHVGVAAWSLALVLGLTWSGRYYQVWPDSGQFVQAFSTYLKPHAHYLVEAPEVPIYYLENNPDAQPRQFDSTYYISYINKKGVKQTGPAGYTSALKDGYFQTVVYYFQVTPPVDGVLAHTLATSHSYYLAAEIGMSDSFGPGDYFVWVKGHAPTPGVFVHAISKYPSLGTKLRELAP